MNTVVTLIALRLANQRDVAFNWKKNTLHSHAWHNRVLHLLSVISTCRHSLRGVDPWAHQLLATASANVLHSHGGEFGTRSDVGSLHPAIRCGPVETAQNGFRACTFQPQRHLNRRLPWICSLNHFLPIHWYNKRVLPFNSLRRSRELTLGNSTQVNFFLKWV